MSRPIDIFVDSKASLENFAREIESLLGIRLQPISDHAEHWFEYRNSRIVLSVGEHAFENDRDMHFEDYRYDIQVRARNIQTESERQKWREEFSRFLFNKLKETQQYRLMLVENLQIKLDEFKSTSKS